MRFKIHYKDSFILDHWIETGEYLGRVQYIDVPDNELGRTGREIVAGALINPDNIQDGLEIVAVSDEGIATLHYFDHIPQPEEVFEFVKIMAHRRPQIKAYLDRKREHIREKRRQRKLDKKQKTKD